MRHVTADRYGLSADRLRLAPPQPLVQPADHLGARLPRSAAVFKGLTRAGKTSFALTNRRSSARRFSQRALSMGVLPQNSARHEQWCAAVLARVAGRRAGARQQAEV